MRDVVEEGGDVGVENAPISLTVKLQHPLDRLVAVTLWDVSKGRIVKPWFKDRSQEPSKYLLSDSIANRWNAQRAKLLRAGTFGYIGPT